MEWLRNLWGGFLGRFQDKTGDNTENPINAGTMGPLPDNTINAGTMGPHNQNQDIIDENQTEIQTLLDKEKLTPEEIARRKKIQKLAGVAGLLGQGMMDMDFDSENEEYMYDLF